MSAALVGVDDLDRARKDPVVFADLLIGQPLWEHQVAVVRSPARYRVLCAGRRAGKTRVIGVLALHQAFAVPRSKVLIVSASDASAKRMFADVLGMATGSPALAVSVSGDNTHLLTLSNGSTIESIPSSQKAARGAEADLLVVDEAGFVDQAVWEAVEPIIGARRGSRVLIASTPWGGPEHFFRSLWRQGMDSPDAEVASWHWPSEINPDVDRGWLEAMRKRSPSDYFEREYLALWTDDAGAFLTEAEIMACVADYEMTPPAELERWLERPYAAVGGVDWGFAYDANVLVLLAVLEDHGLNVARSKDELVYFIPWLEAHFRKPYTDFVERVVSVGKRYALQVVASETNGVGAAPSQILERRFAEERLPTAVWPVVTDVRRKESGYGMIKGLLQTRRLVLPREPELLKQLRGLQFEKTPAGNTKIAVPDAVGHDDIADALMQAVSCLEVQGASRQWIGSERGWGSAPWRGETVSTTDPVSGEVILRVPRKPLPMVGSGIAFRSPLGRERGDVW